MHKFVLPFSFLLTVCTVSQSAFGQDVAVRDTDASKSDSTIVVTYDLFGEKGAMYEVALLISASGGETYDYRPKAVSGDVGEGVTPGTDKRIVWRYRNDFPDGLQQRLKYRVNVQKDGGNRWLYILGGAVVAGGGATAAALLFGGGDDGGYPSPPAPPPGQ